MAKRRTRSEKPSSQAPATTPGDLPEGWAVAPLRDVIQPSKEKIDPKRVPDSPYLGLEHIEANSRRIIGQAKASDAASTKAVFRAGDVLYGKLRPYLNKVCRPTFDGVCSTDIIVFPQKPELDSRFLMYFLNRPDVVEATTHAMAGVNLPRIGFDTLGDLDFPLPPLAEQKRIADRIEALLKSTDTARERLARIPGILSRLRQSILASACSGGLTEHWRGSGMPCTDVRRTIDRMHQARTDSLRKHRRRTHDRYLDPTPIDLDALPELPEFPETWSVSTVGFAAERIQYGTSEKADSDASSGLPNLGMQNIQEGRIELQALKYVKRTAPGVADLILAKGDLLFNRTNSPELVGKSAVFSLTLEASFASYLIRAQLDSRIALPEFVCAWINGSWGRAWAQQVKSDAVSQSNINGTKLANMPLPVPPIEEQAAIIERIRSHEELIGTVQHRRNVASALTSRLVQATLDRAFRGELVAIEAELARAECREYESAPELLARIEAEAETRSHVRPAGPIRAPARPISPTSSAASPSPEPKRAHSRNIFFKRAAIAAYIINKLHTRPTFGRVQLEKCLYLAEAYVGVDLEGEFKRAAAGPLDAEYLYKLESAAHKNGWFVKRTIAGDKTRHTYHPGAKSAQLLAAAEKYLGAGKARMDYVLGWMEKFDTERAEIVATLFAAWSDLLCAGQSATDDAIITEVRENWHESKKRFEPDRLRTALGWMREHHLVPTQAYAIIP